MKISTFYTFKKKLVSMETIRGNTALNLKPVTSSNDHLRGCVLFYISTIPQEQALSRPSIQHHQIINNRIYQILMLLRK
jgi:hypothetical protein